MTHTTLIEIIGAALGGGGIVHLVRARWSNEAVLRRELHGLVEEHRERAEEERRRAEEQRERAERLERRVEDLGIALREADEDRERLRDELASAVETIERLEQLLLREIKSRGQGHQEGEKK